MVVDVGTTLGAQGEYGRGVWKLWSETMAHLRRARLQEKCSGSSKAGKESRQQEISWYQNIHILHWKSMLYNFEGTAGKEICRQKIDILTHFFIDDLCFKLSWWFSISLCFLNCWNGHLCKKREYATQEFVWLSSSWGFRIHRLTKIYKHLKYISTWHSSRHFSTFDWGAEDVQTASKDVQTASKDFKDFKIEQPLVEKWSMGPQIQLFKGHTFEFNNGI